MSKTDRDHADGRTLLEAFKELESSLPMGEVEMKAFLRYLLDEVSVEELLESRRAQLNIHDVSNFKLNPFPKIAIRNNSPEGALQHISFANEPFMLRDDAERLYYFRVGWPIPNENGEVPYLRKEDIIPWSFDEIPGNDFTKPLERALIEGGPVEAFNYNSGCWEERPNSISEPIERKAVEQALAYLKTSGVE